jgi:hypothetical protein
LHPGLRILLYLLSALALPGLSFFVLLTTAALLPVLFPGRVGAMLHLAWRARWLFLLLGLGYAYGLPGGAAWPELGDWSPSTAGLQAAGLHMLRLLLLLWLLDVLVVGMGAQRMMAGLHGLFAGLAWLGFPAERATVRLGLTLQAMEQNSLGFRDITAMLADARAMDGAGTRFELAHAPWHGHDTIILMLAIGGLAAAWLV